jgi:hypothetical protein
VLLEVSGARESDRGWANSKIAYTTYAFFEWALIILDVAFDAVTALDFSTFEVMVRDVRGTSKGYVQWLP